MLHLDCSHYVSELEQEGWHLYRTDMVVLDCQRIVHRLGYFLLQLVLICLVLICHLNSTLRSEYRRR